MSLRLASVPYLNAFPLIARFLMEPGAGVEVTTDLPSRLPSRLAAGSADAILVSSWEALSRPDRQIVPGVCIGSRGPVLSVRLFSRVEFGEIRTLAPDPASMTSNALARILLSEGFSVEPRLTAARESLAETLRHADAAVLIGDRGMEEPSEGLHVLDLGEAWFDLTGLPFVWAAWTCSGSPTEGLTETVNEAAGWAGLGANLERTERSEAVLAEALRRWPMDEGRLRSYLNQVMIYGLDAEMEAGLDAFGRALQRHGLTEAPVSATMSR
ncbi:MAG: menaquinone biosynthesis protein [Fimbriimonadaceae bacterium]|nr:menaquinone biosynthesis protein [Fimbriimonadaceae bacterium]